MSSAPSKPALFPDSNDPLGWIDTPPEDSTQTGVISVSGWALDTSRLDVENLSFTLNGNPITLQNFVYGTGRGDVCDVHSNVYSPNCPMVGWKGDLNTAAFGNGTYTLRLIVTDDAGNQITRDRAVHHFQLIPTTLRKGADRMPHLFLLAQLRSHLRCKLFP